MTRIDATIASRLHAIKDTLHLSLNQMADMCDTPKSGVSNYLLSFHEPRWREVSRLAKATGVSFEWIYLGGEQKIGDETFVS